MSVPFFQGRSEIATIVAAVSSRTLVSLVTSPMEAKRVRMSNMKAGKMFDLNRQQFASSIRATLTRDVIFSGLYWTLVEVVRNKMAGGTEYRRTVKSNLDLLVENALPGCIAGVVSSLVTCPIDTVKTRIQTKSLTYTSMNAELLKIAQNEGISGWFLGWKLRVLKSASHSVLYLVLFEFLLDKISKVRRSYSH